MAKIYEKTKTSRFAVECMGGLCNYYTECRYPPIYCNSHNAIIDGELIEVREYIKGRKSVKESFSFFSMCRRDEAFAKILWNRKILNNFIKQSSKKCIDMAFDFDVLKNELLHMGLWEESNG